MSTLRERGEEEESTESWKLGLARAVAAVGVVVVVLERDGRGGDSIWVCSEE